MFPEDKFQMKGRQYYGRKKREFSKWMIGMWSIACMCWIQQDYIMAFMYQQPVNSSVTVALVSTTVLAILGYFGKSFMEKNSRNKHGLDCDGNPLHKAVEVVSELTSNSEGGSDG